MGVRLWLRLVGMLVPGARRAEWMEEWEGELASRPPSMMDAWGALPDAWTLRREGWTMDRMLHDVRAAWKGLARRPFFTALAAVTLAVGIGANTAIFSVVDAVLINPLPYPHSDRLVSANLTAPGMQISVVGLSEAMYLRYLKESKTLSAFAVYKQGPMNLERTGNPERVAAAEVTREFFDVMGVHPFLGRGFAVGEDRKGAEPVAVLGYGLWQTAFGGDPSVVGRTVDLNGVQRLVVGVMPRGFSYPRRTSLWLPLPVDAQDPPVSSLSYLGIGRMAPGETAQAVQAEMQGMLHSFAQRLSDDFGPGVMKRSGLAAYVRPLRDVEVSNVRQTLWVLMGTVGFVLLIACANVANLFLVRAEARQRERALRTALGATRGDMVRLYLTESVMLALGGGVLGLGLAWVGVRGLVTMVPVTLPRAGEIGIDGSVLGFTAAISVLSGFLFGLFPAFGHGRRDLSGALKEGGRTTTGERKQHRARSALVVVQVAIALILLVGAGLMARSFVAMSHVDLGFATRGRLVFHVSLPSADYPDAARVGLFERNLLQHLEATPGVESAAIAGRLPLESQGENASPVEPVDHPLAEGKPVPMVNLQRVSPGYFQAMGITLLQGRGLTADDEAPGVHKVVIDEKLAHMFWPDAASVLGRRLRQHGATNPALEVVGVARDVHFYSVTENPGPRLYYPVPTTSEFSGQPARALSVVMKVGAAPMSFVSAAREALSAVDPHLPMVRPETMDRIVQDAMAPTSFTVILLGIAAAIALLLGTVGIYGVISYMVSRRTQEIGVRMALGAPRASVLRQVVGQGMALTALGLAVGLLGAWGLSRVLASMLYGVSATDPVTYVLTACFLALVALLASWVPATRAARVDPVEALRSD